MSIITNNEHYEEITNNIHNISLGTFIANKDNTNVTLISNQLTNIKSHVEYHFTYNDHSTFLVLSNDIQYSLINNMWAFSYTQIYGDNVNWLLHATLSQDSTWIYTHSLGWFKLHNDTPFQYNIESYVGTIQDSTTLLTGGNLIDEYCTIWSAGQLTD